MSAEENKAIARRMYAAFSRNDLEGVLAVIADDAVDHALPPGLPSGKAGIRLALAEFLGAFSELTMEPVVLIANGDHVAAHVRCTGRHTGTFMAQAATNKEIDMTITEIIRLEHGLAVERWATEDNLTMFGQLGLQPPA